MLLFFLIVKKVEEMADSEDVMPKESRKNRTLPYFSFFICHCEA